MNLSLFAADMWSNNIQKQNKTEAISRIVNELSKAARYKINI